MSQDTFQLSHHAAEMYESQKVAVLFRPLAEATLQEIPINEYELVLDVACGTGIVSRLIGKKISYTSKIVGVDLNQGMLTVAQELTKDKQEIFEWRHADVGELPFSEDTFTLAFCQQGLQYFPDKIKALSEIRRVLKPNGRLVLTVWSEVSEFILALAESIKVHVGEEVGMQCLAPFSFRDGLVIRNMVMEAGFEDVSLKNLTIWRKMNPMNLTVPKEIASSPVGPKVTSKGQKVIDKIIRDVDNAMKPYQKDSGFIVPQHSHLLQARV